MLLLDESFGERETGTFVGLSTWAATEAWGTCCGKAWAAWRWRDLLDNGYRNFLFDVDWNFLFNIDSLGNLFVMNMNLLDDGWGLLSWGISTADLMDNCWSWLGSIISSTGRWLAVRSTSTGRVVTITASSWYDNSLWNRNTASVTSV